jgi:hypothetical protein
VRVLLGLVVVLLAAVPVLVPLLWTNADRATAPETLRAVAEPGRPALPRDAGASPGPTAAPPPRAGVFASPSPSPTTPSPTTPSPTTPSPTTPSRTPSATPPATATPAAPGLTAAPDLTPSPATPSPSDPTVAPRVAAAGPDLVVVSVGWSPEAPGAGQPVVFAAVVRNAGTEPTPAVTHGIAFSVDGTGVTWSASSSDPLAPGEERTYTADGGDAGNAWIATPGQHTVQARADDLDRIPETDENNNTATATLTIALL